jgi:hypothetical protein
MKMRNLIKVSVLMTLLLIIPFSSFSQDQYRNIRDNTVTLIPPNSAFYQNAPTSKNYFTIQVGSGITYGGTGVMVSLKTSESVRFVAAIGQYSGTPLGTGFAEDDKKFSKKTQTGLGYAIGVKFHYSIDEIYTSFQYINAGKYKDEYTDEIALTGLNWTMFGGNHSIANSNFFFDWGLNFAIIFRKEFTGMFGLSLGLGYKF